MTAGLLLGANPEMIGRMRRPARALALAWGVLLALAGTTSAAVAAPGTITHYPTPKPSSPYGIAVGPDGRIWWSESGNAAAPGIGRMATDGSVVAPAPINLPATSLGGALAIGPDGNMWVQQDNHIAKVPVGVTQTSDITSYTLSTGSGGFSTIAAGPDGRLWYGQKESVGASTTSGTLDVYGTSAPMFTSITGLLSGPGNRIWYTIGDSIESMSTSGVVGAGNTFPLPAGNHGIYWMTLGPDGNLWFTQSSPPAVGRMTPAGTFTIFPTPTAASLPFGITPGPDGKLWFVERNGDNIGSIPTTATSGADITEYPVGGTNVGLEYIVAGPDNRMWFNEFNTPGLGAITTGAAATTPPAPTPPAPTPPGPVAPAAPAPISASKAFTLPSSKACVSRRSFTIRVRKLPGVSFVKAVVKVNGKRVKTVSRARITAPVNLKGLPSGRFRVSITATAADGRVVTGSRTYRTCAKKRRSSGPRL